MQDAEEEMFPVNEEWASADRHAGNLPLGEVYSVVCGPVSVAKQRKQACSSLGTAQAATLYGVNI